MFTPCRVLVIVAAMRERGPLSRDDIHQIGQFRQSGRASESIGRWVSSGWIVAVADGRYDLGPKAIASTEPPPHTLPKLTRQSLADRTSEEGSDQWLILAQLSHEPLRAADLADLLDKAVSTTELSLRVLRKLSYVERCQDGKWRLASSEAAE